MKKLINVGIIPIFLLALFLSFSSCELQPDVQDDIEETIPDFRDDFTGEFEFNWINEVTRDGHITTTTQGSHVGLIEKYGTDMLDIHYRPEAFRRMVLSSAGILTEGVVNEDGYVANGAYTGMDALQLEITGTSGSSSVKLTISGVRK